MDVVFAESQIEFQGVSFVTVRRDGRDVIIARGAVPASAGLEAGQTTASETVFPASYHNMLVWERTLAPERRLIAINGKGHPCGFGAGNRIVLSDKDTPGLGDQTSFGGWDGIHRGLLRSTVPFWYIQQSIVRELIPEGVDPLDYPGIGHTGGYGPREFLRAGLFAYASQGGYAAGVQPIGADADHAIIVGYDEESLAKSLAFNKLAMSESADYTKFTVDTSHLFDFPVSLSPADEKRLMSAFSGRAFHVDNIVPGNPAFDFAYDDAEIARLGRKYWRACAIHKDLFDHAEALRQHRRFDYELSLDETPDATRPRDLLFYMVMLQDVMGLPAHGVDSAGPNVGFIKRHDFEGDLAWLGTQVNACASILHHFGAMLSVHSADGVGAANGKGPGVDKVIAETTLSKVELKVADVYQEVLWQVLAVSPARVERELFLESWRRTYEAGRMLGILYQTTLKGMETRDVQRLLATAVGRDRITSEHGEQALVLAQGTIGYGLPVFRLASELAPKTDSALANPDAELFRRFMFLTYRSLRPAIFQTMTHDGWERLAVAVEDATMIRLRTMGWSK
jgi:hypothetical protein